MTIKELREEKGLSQGKFAESIGIGRTAIVGYEKGKFKPSAEVAAKIKEVYGVDVDEAASAAPAPAEEKPAKRGKKKDTPAAVEATPAVEEKKSAQKKGGRKKAAASETAPAVEEKKPARKKGGRKKAALASETAPATEEKTPAQKKPTRKKKDEEAEQPAPKKPTKRGKKAAPAVEEAKPVEEKKPRGKKKAEAAPKKDDGVVVVIQSPLGGSITPEEILKKTGKVDAVYARVDENKAYWVRGDETGSVDLW